MRKQQIDGVFSSQSDHMSNDCALLLETIERQVDFSQDNFIFIGFAELSAEEQSFIVKNFEEGGIANRLEKELIVAHITNTEQLKIIFKNWSESGGSAGQYVWAADKNLSKR